MAMSLIGLLITAGIIAIFLWALMAILQHMGIVVPQIVLIIAAAVIGIILLVILAQLLGAPIGLRAAG